MPLPSHPELERRALRAAAGVICTSSFGGGRDPRPARARRHHGWPCPGTDARPARPPVRTPPHIVAVAALLPNKDQSLLLAALSRLAGPAVDGVPGRLGRRRPRLCRAAPGRRASRLGLQDRVRIPGELRGEALEAEWARGGPQPAHLPGRDLRPGGHGIAGPRHPGGGACRHRSRGGARGSERNTGASTGRRRIPAAGRRRRTWHGPGPARRSAAALADRPGAPDPLAGGAARARDRLPGWDATARAVDCRRPGATRAGQPPAAATGTRRRRMIPTLPGSWWTMSP